MTHNIISQRFSLGIGGLRWKPWANHQDQGLERLAARRRSDRCGQASICINYG